jgi:membrane fusion protein (multidrug efflux system)
VGEETFVFRVVDGKAARVKVVIGQRRDGEAEVVAGLTADDTVVTAGQMKIRDGVMVIGPAPGAPSSPPAKG